MINIAIKLATSITYTADGSQTNFSVPFDYLRPSFVHVSVNDAEVSEGFTISNRMVMFDSAPAKDAVVHIYRSTPTTRLVSWADASILKAIDMTIAEVQQLHILEEGQDWSKTNSIILDRESGAWQGRNYRISNITDPTEAQDVVTKHYLENTEDSFVQRMNAIKTQTEQFMNTAGNHKDSAYKSAQSASASAASAAESARLAEGYKTAAETAKSNASLYAANAKTSADNAGASKEAAQSAATTASNFASAARNSAGEAKTYKDNAKTYMDDAKTYMDNAKNYSENVNVFVPSVSSAGVLSWTNKAGLTNPKSVNIKGAKGDTGTAATITIGSVTTGAPGTNASVTNSGTSSAAILNFQIPRGTPGADGGVTVDEELSDTSFNPVANKVIKEALDAKANKNDVILRATGDSEGNNIVQTYAKKSDVNAALADKLSTTGAAHSLRMGTASGDVDRYIPFQHSSNSQDNFSAFCHDNFKYNPATNNLTVGTINGVDVNNLVKTVNGTAPDTSGNVTIEVSGGGAQTSEENTWTGQQTFNKAILKDTVLVKARIRQEVYQSEYINGTTITPTRSTMRLVATGATTLDMTTIVAECLGNNKTSTVFTAYITSDADYTLTIINAGTIKYIGSASDVAITSAGLLLNIMMLKDASGNLTSIVQASKLEGGA